MSSHFEVLRMMLIKVVSEHLLWMKNSEDLLKPTCMMKNASHWVFVFGKLLKTRSYIEDLSKATSRSSSIKIKLYQSLHHNDEELDIEDWTSKWSSKWFRMHLTRQHLTYHMMLHSQRVHRKWMPTAFEDAEVES